MATKGEGAQLHFYEVVEILPQTARTQAILEQKALEEKQKRDEEKRRLAEEEAEKDRLRKEESEDLRRAREKKKRQEQERNRRREEEAQKSQLHGGLGHIFKQLSEDKSPWEISMAGYELNNVRMRLLMNQLRTNKSCHLLDLNRQNLVDCDGETIAECLEANPDLGKLTLEGNHLGVHSATLIANALCKNKKLLHLSLASNAITNMGNQQGAIVAIANMLRENKFLHFLDLSRNHISASSIDILLEALEENFSITNLELHGNDLTAAQADTLLKLVERNRGQLSAIRRRERFERQQMMKADEESKTVWAALEEKRKEIQEIERKRLMRMKERLERWREDAMREAHIETEIREQLMQAAEDRKAAKKKKKKGKKKA